MPTIIVIWRKWIRSVRKRILESDNTLVFLDPRMTERWNDKLLTHAKLWHYSVIMSISKYMYCDTIIIVLLTLFIILHHQPPLRKIRLAFQLFLFGPNGMFSTFYYHVQK